MRSSLGCVLLLFLAYANAPAAPLPTDIQSCAINGTCLVSVNPVFQVANTQAQMDANGFAPLTSMSAYNYTDATGSKLLIEYSLVTPSRAEYTTWNGYTGGMDTTTSTSTGSVWLLVNQQYDLADNSHRARIYWDQAQGYLLGSSLSIWDGYTDVIFNNTALLTGALRDDFSGYTALHYGNARFTYGFDAHGYDSDAFASYCLYGECDGGFAQFNFLYFAFSDTDNDGIANLAFKPDSASGLLYESFLSEQYGDTIYRMELYAPSPVPVPATTWLLASGIGLLSTMMRRKQRQNKQADTA